MPSLKSKLFNFMLRNRHLLKGKWRKEVFDFNTSIEDFRAECEKGAAKYAKIPEGVQIREQIIDGVKSEWLIPQGANEDQLVLYVHGGGYVSGSCSDHRNFVSKFARRTSFSLSFR